jgi:lipoprotein-releasing system permease protein
VAGKIEALIERDRGDYSYFVTKVSDLFPHLFDWLVLLDFNVIIVMVLMIAVAGFNMISGLLILLFERISMIGVLKALGMRNSSIHKIFMTRAMVLVMTGMIVGNILAYMVAFIQYKWQVIPLDPSNYFVDHVPVSPSFLKILFFNMAAFGVIFLLLLIPSMFISRVSPEKTLKVK